MTPAPLTLADLRVARDVLRADRRRATLALASALEAIMAGEDAYKALGLKGRAGQRSALTLERLHRRDDFIRQLAARHFAALSVSDQARSIVAAGAAYWRRAAMLDRELASMPASYADTPRELLFGIARLPADMPKERTIRAILSALPHELMD